ncbi:cobaltochelatase subunit CobN [Methanolobus sp. ZRKC2]|uniref:cobaltochelatase subunit CobN n=1 Tax=Methanolobus sp. ZRKC2 TaxID=3125783 RepID=UPI00325153FD
MKENTKKTVLKSIFLTFMLIVVMPAASAATTYDFSDVPGADDVLIARTYSDDTVSSGTLEEDFLNAPDGDYYFSGVPDGDYKLYLAYWTPFPMNSWSVANADVTVSGEQIVEDVWLNVTLLDNTNPTEMAWGASFYDIVANSTVTPVSGGTGAISGTAYAPTAPMMQYRPVRGATIGLYAKNDTQNNNEEEYLNITSPANIAFVVVGDDFVPLIQDATEELNLNEQGIDISLYAYSRQPTVNVSYNKLSDDVDLGEYDVIFLGSMTAMSFMGESVSSQVHEIVNETKDPNAVVIDAGGFGLGTVDLEEHPHIEQYWNNQTGVNAQRMLAYILINFCGAEGNVKPPIEIPSNGIYHPDAELPFENIEQYLQWYSTDDGTHHVYNPDNITIGMPFLINTDGNIGNKVIDDAVRRLEARGVNVIPTYMHWVLYTTAPDFFKHEDEWVVDGFIDMGMGVMLSTQIQETSYLQEANVPIINAIQYEGTIEEWENSTTGRGFWFQYQIPIMEMGGHIESIVVSGKKYDEEYGILVDEPIPAQMEWMINRTLNWVNLKNIENEDRKVALIYYHHSPGRDGAMAAANLDVGPSISLLLEAMDERDYDLNNQTPNQTELLDLVLKQGRNIGAWAPDELEKIVNTNEVELLPVDEYMEMFNQLPEEARNEVIDTWGEAPGEIMVYENESGEYFVFPKISLGNVLLAPQPTRGGTNNTEVLYHDQTLPPDHQYIAFYLWLQHKYEADAVVHLGQHGTQEWLKGKGVGLSATEDWPALVIGDMPVVYVYNVGGIAEGVVAKRRGNCAIVDHATPPIVEAGLYGDLSNLHQKIHLYTEADQLNESIKMEYREGIINLYETVGFENELGVSPSNMTEMTEEEFEAFVIRGPLHDYIHELSAQYMPYGLHILGQPPEGEGLVAMVKSMLGSSFLENVGKVYGDEHVLEPAHSPNLLDEMLTDLLINGTNPETVMETYLNVTGTISQEVIGTTTTDSEGYYYFDNLSDGKYSVLSCVELTGMPGMVFYKTGDEDLFVVNATDEKLEIELESSDETSVNAIKELPGKASISGQVWFSDMEGVRLNASNATVLLKQESVLSTTITDSDGYYNFTNLSDGNYTVLAYLVLDMTSSGGPVIHESGQSDLLISNMEDMYCEFKMEYSDKLTVDALKELPGKTSLSGQVYYMSKQPGAEGRTNASDATVVLVKEHSQLSHDELEVKEDLETAITYGENIAASTIEVPRVLDALEGQYILPGLGDDPLRSPHVLPTGRNFYAFNPYIVPPEEVWNAGTKLADEFLEEWKANHDEEYPRKVGFVLWSAETMRHKGIMESEILYLMGMRPVWDDFGNFVDVEPIPCEELTHPRIDVVVTMTGVYRESWTLQVEMMDRAARKAASLNETNCGWPNYVKQNSDSIYDYLMETGNYTEEEARSLSQSRIFGPPAGMWGVGGLRGATTRSDTWDSEEDLANLYLKSMAYSYGENGWGEHNVDLFKQVLGGTDALLFSRSGNDGRGSSSVVFDHVYEFFGGMGMAIRSIDGATPEMYIVNLKNPDDMKTETLASYLVRDMRSTYYNPKWIQGMMGHDYAGAQEMQSLLDDLWGLEAMLPGTVTDEMWKEMYEIYIEDKYNLGTKEWFEEKNPWARQTMIARMLETTRKLDREGNPYWDAPEEIIQKLANEYQESINNNGPCCCAICCGNVLLDEYTKGFVASPVSLDSSDSSSGGSGTGSAKVVSASSNEKHGESKSNQTSNADGGYGTDKLHSPTPDNYVEGYEMQPEATSDSQDGASGMSSSGAAILGTVIVLMTLGVVYMGFRRS